MSKTIHVIPSIRVLFIYEDDNCSYEAIELSVDGLRRLRDELDYAYEWHGKKKPPKFEVISLSDMAS